MKIFIIVFLALFLVGCNQILSENVPETVSINQNTVPVMTTISETTLPTFAQEDNTDSPVLCMLTNPKDTDFVRVTDYIPSVVTDLKYASADNFTGKVIYDFEDVFLRYGTVMKLKFAADELQQKGFYLKIWDGFRPVSAQFKLWEICPDPTFVADPNKGFSNHSRGFAVDLTLVDAQGREVVMPTGFDDFSARADRDYSDCPPEAAENAKLLEQVMEKYGFKGYWGEWWHFNDTVRYDVETCFDPSVILRRCVTLALPLLESYCDPNSTVLTVPAGEYVTLLGYDEEYVLAEYWGYRGYLPAGSFVDDP